MAKTFLMIAAISGLLAVAIGAFGAHGLKARLAEDLMAAFQTADALLSANPAKSMSPLDPILPTGFMMRAILIHVNLLWNYELVQSSYSAIKAKFFWFAI